MKDGSFAANVWQEEATQGSTDRRQLRVIVGIGGNPGRDLHVVLFIGLYSPLGW
jgi:hypothetical protein